MWFTVRRYGGAMLAVVIALAIKLLLDGFTEQHSTPFLFFFAAVTVGAWYGGFGPGLAAMTLSALLSAVFFVGAGGPNAAPTGVESVRVAIFLVESLLICLLCHGLRTARRHSDASRQELRAALDESRQTTRALGRATDDLHDREERLRQIIDTALDAVIAIDAEGRVVEWNPQAEAIFGWSKDEALGRPVAALIIPEPSRDAHRAGLKHFLDTGEGPLLNQRLEVSALHRDGHEFPVELTITPARRGGRITFSAFVRDISAQKRSAQAASRLAAIVESSEDAIIGETLDGFVTNWNRGAERMFGYRAEEIVGRSIALIVPADRMPEVRCRLADIAEGERLDPVETVRVRKDGHRLDVSLVVSPICDAGGAVSGASVIARDISSGKAAEKALREKTKTLETINRINTSLAAELDLDALVRTVADAGVALTGAQLGAFFYKVKRAEGDAYNLFLVAGEERKKFADVALPRDAELFGPTFRGQGVVRMDDVTQDPRYAESAAYFGPMSGHLPVRGYLAASVISRSGEVIGGLFFGHEEAGVFTEQAEDTIVGIASQAAIAIDNARLYRSLADSEAEAQRQFAQLNVIYENTPVGLCFVDTELRYVSINHRLAEINGRSIADHIGKTIREVIPDLADRIEPINREVIRSGQPAVDIEIRTAVAADPFVERDWLVSYYPVHGGDGSVIGVNTVVQDVTERKRAETRSAVEHAVTRILAEAETLDDAAPRIIDAIGAVMEVDVGELCLPEPGGRTLHCEMIRPLAPSAAVEEFGVHSRGYHFALGEGLPGRVWDTRKAAWIDDLGEDADFHRGDLARQAGLSTAVAFPIQTTDEFFGVMNFFSSKPLPPDYGWTRMMEGIGAEMGRFIQRRRAEENLRRTEHELTDFVENATIGLHWVGPDGLILWANQSELDLLGYTRDEYLGRPIADFHADQPVIQDILERLTRNEELHGYEARLRCKDGSVRHVLIDSNVYRENGEFIHTRCFTRDITERKRAEQALRFLAGASALLAESLDYETTMTNVAELIVPGLADWCAIDVLNDEGGIDQVAVIHSDPEKIALAQELRRRYPPRLDAPRGVANVLRTGQSELYEEIPDELLVESAQDEDHLRIMRDLGLKSAVVVPLAARGKTLGAITIVTAEHPRRYGQREVSLMEELARYCGLAVDNARLYREAQREIEVRRQAEESLRENDERLRFTLNAARVGTWDWNIVTSEVRWSENMEAVHRLAAGAFDGSLDSFFNDVHPLDRDGVKQTIGEALEKRQDYVCEYRLNRPDGEIAWVEGKGRVICDEQGNPIRMGGVCMDVTARKRAEEKLREQAELLDLATDAIIVRDLDDRILFWNRGAEEMYGWPQNEALAKDIHVLLQTEFDQPSDALRKRLLQEDRWEGEVTQARGDGVRLVVGTRWALLREPNGEPQAVLEVNRDITQRKQTEDRLARQTLEARLLQQATALAAETDSFAEALQSCVDIVCEITGWPVGHVFLPDDDDGETLTSAGIWRQNAPRKYAPLRRVSEQSRYARGVGLPGRVWSSGRPLWIMNIELDDNFPRGELCAEIGVRSAVAFPIKVKDQTVAIVEFFSDREMPLDPTLLGMTSSVGEQLGRVFERKRALDEVRRAMEAAEAASRAKSEFLANVSHELRTPMNAIIGMTQLALAEELSPLLRDYLETAKGSADVLLELVNDVLDFSKLESGKFVLEEEPFSLRSQLDLTVRSFSIRAAEKQIELACDLPHQTPDRLVGDPLRLRQILMNLVGNAVKFTDHGEVVVRVEVESRTDDDVMLRFAVADTGVGISPEDQVRIFAPFTQADASSTRRFSGTGLGLAIASELTRMMDGRLWVESEVGRGSTFYFTVRCEIDAVDGDDESSLPPDAAALRGMRVLVVDDNATNRRIVEQSLKHWGMAPTLAADANSALAEMQAATDAGRGFPLVILDALMPGVDGFTLAERIKERSELAGAAVLMLSSADRQAFAERCSKLDIAAYLEKPITRSDLLSAILSACTGRAAEGAASEVTPLSPKRRSLRVLLAEDTPANQKVVTTVLRRRGHFVEIAEHGGQAVDLIQRGKFDLVLMDVQMPVMDGFQATSAIRALETHLGGRIPIVALTAHALKGDQERCLAAGMDGYIAKPVDMDRLIELVEQFGSPGGRRRRIKSAAAVSTRPAGPKSRRDAPPDDAPVFDVEAALGRLAGDRALFESVVRLFVEDSPPLLRRISQGVQENDASAVFRAAHSLKGLASNFDGHRATAAAFAIEQAASSGDLDAARAMLPKLSDEVRRLSNALADHHWADGNGD